MAKKEYIRIMTASEREKLYHEVWQEPMIVVAQKYGISNVELRNRCLKVEIPLPPMGYWRRKSGRESIPIPPLEPISEGNRKYIANFKVEYEMSNEQINGKQVEILTKESQDDIKRYCKELLNIEDKEWFHIEVKNHINYIRLIDGIICYDKPNSIVGKYFCGVFSSGESDMNDEGQLKLLPIKVRKEDRKRAYKVMNAFLNIVESFEGELKLDNEFRAPAVRLMEFAQYGIGRPIYIEILDIKLEFMLEEIKETATTTPRLSLWLKVISGKEIDKRMESEYRQKWYCLEDNKEYTVEEGLADFIIMVLTYLHLFKGKRGSCLKTKGIEHVR